MTGLRYDPGTRAHPVSTLANLGAKPDALAMTLAGYVPQRFPDVAGTPAHDVAPSRFAWRGHRATPSRISLTVLLGAGLLGAVWGVVDTPGRDRWVPGGFVLFIGFTLTMLWQDAVPYLIIDDQGIRYTSEATVFKDAPPVELLWDQVAATAVAGSRWRARLLVQPVGSPRDRAALTGVGFGHRTRGYGVCPLRPVRADPDHVRAALAAHGHRLARTDTTG